MERKQHLCDKLKEIFKKYGITVASLLIAAGAVIDAVVSFLTKALRKKNRQSFGKRFARNQSKSDIDFAVLIDSIVGFIFKTGGQAIGFLAEHTWLLIFAAVAFLIEKVIKKQR